MNKTKIKLSKEEVENILKYMTWDENIINDKQLKAKLKRYLKNIKEGEV